MSTLLQDNGGNPKSEYYILKPIGSSEMHSSIKFYSTRDHICLFRGRLSLFIFPPSSMPQYPQVMFLRLNLSYLWYRDSIRKNLTQFLRGLVLELLKSIFKVAYKRVRILARYLRLKTPWWESVWTLEPQHETINTGCLFLITTKELHVNLNWPWWPLGIKSKVLEDMYLLWLP